MSGQKQNLFWHLLFADCLFLILRFGGLAVIDFAVHGCFLLLATLALMRVRARHPIPRLVYWVFLPVLGLCLLQLVPLPDALLSSLAPVKWRVMEQSRALFPDLVFGKQITMIPQFHSFKLAIFALDAYAVFLLIAAPAPAYRLLRGWLVVFGSTIGLLMIWESKDLLVGTPLDMYQGTFGGLINQNHFACLCVLLILPLLGLMIEQLRTVYKIYRDSRPLPVNRVLKGVTSAALCGMGLILLLIGFQAAYSRSGIVDFVLGLSLFTVVLGLKGQWIRRRWPLVAGVGLLMVVLLTLPLGRGLEKFLDRGIEAHKRLDYLKAGVAYLKEWPLLGVGLGSTEGVLNQTDPKEPYQTDNVREYHNDFLQTLVELGPIGLLSLLLFMGWLIREVLGRCGEKHFRGRNMGAVLLGILAMLCFHSLVSFPLRVTAVRFTALVLLFVFLKDRDLQRGDQPSLLPLTPLLLLPLIGIMMMMPRALRAEQMQTADESRSLHYGRFFRLPLFQANEQLGAIFNNPNATVAETLSLIPKVRALSLEHMRMQTYSVKGLNQLYMLEVLEFRLQRPEYDREAYLEFKRTAQAIGDLGGNNNFHARSALLFLYATYQQYLDEEEQADYEAIKEAWRYKWMPAKRRLNPPNTQ